MARRWWRTAGYVWADRVPRARLAALLRNAAQRLDPQPAMVHDPRTGMYKITLPGADIPVAGVRLSPGTTITGGSLREWPPQ